MVSRKSGHFVQVFKPLAPRGRWLPMPKPKSRRHARQSPNYVTVEGRATSRTVSEYPFYAQDGWFYMSRELPRKKAIKFARAYRRAGFKSRVVLLMNSGRSIVTDEFQP